MRQLVAAIPAVIYLNLILTHPQAVQFIGAWAYIQTVAYLWAFGMFDTKTTEMAK